jgi:hypothetical protein
VTATMRGRFVGGGLVVVLLAALIWFYVMQPETTFSPSRELDR